MNSVRAILELLFITCLVFLFVCRKPNEATTPVYERIQLLLPKDGKNYPDNGLSRRFDGEVILKEQKGKGVISISLLGDPEEDSKRMDFIRFKARELLFTNDTTQYIKISLSNTLTYRQLIDLLRMVNEDKHKRYMLFRDNFYIFSEPPPPPDEEKIEIKPIYL